MVMIDHQQVFRAVPAARRAFAILGLVHNPEVRLTEPVFMLPSNESATTAAVVLKTIGVRGILLEFVAQLFNSAPGATL